MSEPTPTSVEAKTASAPKQALVLSGGHVKGAYQAGAIAEILQCDGFKPSAIYGISVGSINGGMLASYVGQQFLDDPKRTEADFSAAANDVERFWREKIREFKDIACPRSLIRILWEVFRKDFRGILNVDSSIGIIRAQIKPENLKKAAEKGLKFYAGTINLTTGDYHDDPADSQEVVDYVIASCMAPIVMPMWAIPSQAQNSKPFLQRWRENRRERLAREGVDHKDRDNSWLDGGIHNPVPVSAAIEAGYDDIICVLTRPDKIGRGSFQGRLGAIGERISDVVAQKLLDVDIQYSLDMKDWLDFLAKIQPLLTKAELGRYVGKTPFEKYRSFQLTVVRPSRELPYKIETLKKGQTSKMADSGREDARAVMSHYKRHVPAP